MHFHVRALRAGFRPPTRGEDGDGRLVDPHAAGYDLRAPEDGFIDPLQRKVVPLGFAAAFTPGWAAILMDRSGMGSRGIHRFAGVIDPTYRGEWKVVLHNSTPEVFRFSAGDRIVQVLFVQVGMPEVTLVGALDESGRGDGGFGSTGT